ncbi:MAG: diguanylate cyclase [Eubacteriales bacterium]|nr:diguanylate cyclase [Eubacteriales bacterium]
MTLHILLKNPRRMAIVLLAIVLTVLFIFIKDQTNIVTKESIATIAEWSDDSGTYPLPHEYPAVSGESYTISAVLPETLTGREYLIFRTENISVQVAVNGATLYSTGEVPKHHTIGDEWHYISLPADAAGQTVTINSTILFPLASKFISSVYLGLRADFLQIMFRRQLPEFMISVLLFLVGVALLFSKMLIKRQLMSQLTVSFAVFCMALGIWTAIQTSIIELLWGQTELLIHITYSTLSFATAMICYFLRVLPGPKWLKKTYFWFGIVQIITWVFTIVGEALHFAAYVETLPYVRMAMGVLLVLFFFQIPAIFRRFNDYTYLITGFLCLVATMVADLTRVYSGVYDYAHNTRFGLLLMAVLIAIQSIIQIRKGIRASDEADLMRRLAYKDSLTGLNNRLALVRDQERLIEQKTGCVGIVQMDINNLKIINDQYGHEEGDLLILRAAKAITNAFNGMGESYRVGGDEFVTLITRNSCGATSEECLERLMRACDEQNEGQEHLLSIALGFAVYDAASGDRFYDLVRIADMRMYENKRAMKAKQSGPAASLGGGA